MAGASPLNEAHAHESKTIRCHGPTNCGSAEFGQFDRERQANIARAARDFMGSHQDEDSMTSHKFAIIAFTSAAALVVACASSSAQSPAVKSVAYQCGPQRVLITLEGDKLTLKTATTEYALQRVASADGAKYASP